MTTILECPDRSAGELRFRLFDIPVRVHPWFWLTTLMMGATDDVGLVLIWVGVCFVSILVHELGHVIAFRSFGVRAEAVLYAWGGLAVPDRSPRKSTFAEVVISVAGPAAGFLLAALVIAAASFAGAKIFFGFEMFVIPTVRATLLPAGEAFDDRSLYYWNVILNDLLYVNIYWGLVNLLPIYPLDGGRVSRALFEHRDPNRGIRRSLLVSAIVAAAVAVLGLATKSMYLLIMFGVLAAGSATMWEAQRRFTGSRPYRPR
jgi:stage IV sporulation protein FB